MAYFSNSSEGESFKESYCYSCVHWNDKDDGRGFGCPVMDVHILFNSGHLDNQLIKRILNIFIPAGCSMFIHVGDNCRVPFVLYAGKRGEEAE